MRVPRAWLPVVAACIAASCSLGRRSPSPVADGAATATRPEPPAAPARPHPTTADPVLLDWALYDSVETLARAGDVDGARTTALVLAERVPDSIWLGRARLEVGLAFLRAGDPATAAEWLALAARALDHDLAYWARAELAGAEATARLGANAAAIDRARSVRARLPRTLAARRARRLTARLARRDAEMLARPEARLAEAELRLAEGDPAGALRIIDRLGAGAGPYRDRAWWVEARARHDLGDPDRATRLCRALAAHADPALGALALQAAARWRWNADDDAAAERLFEEVRRRFPDSEEARAASYALGRIHQTAGRYDAAVAEYDRIQGGRLATDAAWGAAWARYLAGRWDDAASRFRALGADAGGEGDGAAAYWEARALLNVGDPSAMAALQRLAERHPDQYYGYMAARYLAGAGLGESPPVLAPPPPPFPGDLVGPHADRARAYLALGERRFARRELDRLAAFAPGALLIDAYEAVGAPGRAFDLVRRTLRVDDRRDRRLYPLGYWEAVQPAAARAGVDPLLVLAVIRQESGFDDEAVSPADAHGLMQLVPATAAEIARDLGIAPPDRWALRRVPLNVTLGSRLLARLLREYDGSEIRALAAYNAGRDAVAKWGARHGDHPDDEFVELISYAETRRYVKRVLDAYLRYRRLYAPTAAAMSAGSPPNAPFDMMTMTSPGRADSIR